jgi:hypothetical protein
MEFLGRDDEYLEPSVSAESFVSPEILVIGRISDVVSQYCAQRETEGKMLDGALVQGISVHAAASRKG